VFLVTVNLEEEVFLGDGIEHASLSLVNIQGFLYSGIARKTLCIFQDLRCCILLKRFSTAKSLRK